MLKNCKEKEILKLLNDAGYEIESYQKKFHHRFFEPHKDKMVLPDLF